MLCQKSPETLTFPKTIQRSGAISVQIVHSGKDVTAENSRQSRKVPDLRSCILQFEET